MRKIFEITNENGDVINRIIATQAYVEAVYPGRFTFIENAPEPEPVPVDPVPRAPGIVAQGRLHIDGFDVSGINGNIEIAAAYAFDVGMIFCEFREPLAWADYIVTTGTEAGHHSFVSVENQAAEGFLLCTQNSAGEPSFPSWVQLVVSR